MAKTSEQLGFACYVSGFLQLESSALCMLSVLLRNLLLHIVGVVRELNSLSITSFFYQYSSSVSSPYFNASLIRAPAHIYGRSRPSHIIATVDCYHGTCSWNSQRTGTCHNLGSIGWPSHHWLSTKGQIIFVTDSMLPIVDDEATQKSSSNTPREQPEPK